MEQATIRQKYFRQGRLVTIPKKEKAKLQLFHYFQQQLAQQGQQFT
ncbi:hypothetical protein ABPH35_00420 [Streptococcus sp. ZJ93]